jgi:O-antigen ligase
MELKVSRAGIILLLLSGLVFHNFLTIESLKIGAITVTYLRIILLITIPFLFYTKPRLRTNDNIAFIILVFMLYGLTRISGNLKEALAIYCPLIAFYFLYTSIDQKQLVKRFVNCTALFAMFFCLVGIFELITGHHFYNESNAVLDIRVFASGMYYNPNDFSGFLTVGIFYILLSGFHKEIKALFAGLSVLIIYINSSQICLLGILSFMLVAFILGRKTNRFIRFSLSALVGLAMLSIITDMIKNSSLVYRLYMYRFGIKNCLEHVWFGTGIGNYGSGMWAVGYTPLPYTSTDPHNLYLEIAGQFGMIWAILLIILTLKLLIWFYKRAHTSEGILCLGLIYITVFVGLSSSSSMEKNYIYLALLAPLLYYRLYNDEMNRTFADNAVIEQQREQVEHNI